MSTFDFSKPMSGLLVLRQSAAVKREYVEYYIKHHRETLEQIATHMDGTFEDAVDSLRYSLGLITDDKGHYFAHPSTRYITNRNTLK